LPVFIRSSHAIVRPQVNVRMVPARFHTAGRLVTSPGYLYTFSSNAFFAQNPLPPVTFDQPLGISGNEHSLLSAHLRYDTIAGAGVAFTEHLADAQRADVVFGLEPFHGGRLDVFGTQTLTHSLTQQLIGDALPGTRFVSYSLQHSEAYTTTRFAFTQFNGSQTDDVSISSFDREIGRIGSYRLGVDYGFDRFAGGLPFATEFRTTLNGTLASPPLRGPFGSNLGLRYDLSSTTYDYGHQLFSGTLTTTLDRALQHGLYLSASAAIAAIDSRYGSNADQLLNLPPPGTPYFAPDGTPFPGYFAYRGLATQRTYALTVTDNPRPDLSVALGFTYANDFPQFHGLGRPPLTANLYVRVRVAPSVALQFSRSYLFGWAGTYFSPAYSLQVFP
ncbi:MAG: hypothetical protein ACREM8_13640, partial [Vulcanimicrobiaceae bacterium]